MTDQPTTPTTEPDDEPVHVGHDPADCEATDCVICGRTLPRCEAVFTADAGPFCLDCAPRR